MRTVNRQEFLKLPEGTIYCSGVRWAFDAICIKGESLGTDDWVYLDMSWPDAQDSGEALQLLETSIECGTSFKAQEAWGRDGCFEKDAVFLIYEDDDLRVLAEYIAAAIRQPAPEEGK